MLFLLGGAVFDLRSHRIPNWWIACCILAGLGLEWWLLPAGEGMREAWWPALLFFLRLLAVSVLFFPLFRLRMIGAGDIKLMALMCGCLGMIQGGLSIIYGFVLGAALSLIKLLVQGSFMVRFMYLSAYIRRIIHTKEIVEYYNPARDGYESTIPLGLCLFLGTLIYLLLL